MRCHIQLLQHGRAGNGMRRAKRSARFHGEDAEAAALAMTSAEKNIDRIFS